MWYEPYTAERLFTEITTEAAAQALLWRWRLQGKEVHSPHCHAEECYVLATRPALAEAVSGNFDCERARSWKPRRRRCCFG